MSAHKPDPFRPLHQVEKVKAAQMWRAGKNTADIAKELGLHEAAVCRALEYIRFMARGLARGKSA